MRYLPVSDSETQQMLDAISMTSIDAVLHAAIPRQVRFEGDLDLPRGVSEIEVLEEARALADENLVLGRRSFLGGGFSYRMSPVMVSQLLLRSEFYTAYTPYQPEVAQGTLQAIFEFQTMICQLTGMDVANASLYDGATAVTEAALMALRVARGKRKRVVAAGTIDPHALEVLKTYVRHLDVDLQIGAVGADGRAVFDDDWFDDQLAVVIVPQVNYLGLLEDLDSIIGRSHDCGGLAAIVVGDATSMALLRSPGSYGVDIVCGEGQALGVPISFGGPSLGLFATTSKLMRQMPGRLVGQTVDVDGRRGFVLTLSTREQHIRREKATSNICTNQGLMALAACIHMAALGKSGLMEVARRSAMTARYTRAQLSSIEGVKIPFDGPIYNEFVIETSRPSHEVISAMQERGFLIGLPLDSFGWGNRMLVACNEFHRKSDVQAMGEALGEVLA